MEPNRQGEVWVVAEHDEGSLIDVTLELCGKARALADQLGVRAGAVLTGSFVEDLASDLIAYGAEVVYVVDHECLRHYRTSTYAQVLVTLVNKIRPQIVMYGATPQGRDLAPRVASALRAGMTADCTDLEIQDVTDPKTKTVHEKLLLQIRPAFGGNIIATIVNHDLWPQMVTVREGVMPLLEPDDSRSGQILHEHVDVDQVTHAVRLIERYYEPHQVNLKGARVIVAGGGGVGSKANFQLIHQLAGAIGGAVGASRAAVDGGYIGKEHQIGQTGTTVRPALYIACGISGAVQHRAGMEESAKIIAINTDRNAAIFSVAHYGIVGDLNRVITMLIKALKARR
ncbi:MAG: electron transfer flavoprotein subunit alpha [Planctomycetes bacterium RBG_16_64_10]|nr:MAG: electron transfer flavoprotein subunit alpha [Planctomycetes bacterium RBG_16_64_10]